MTPLFSKKNNEIERISHYHNILKDINKILQNLKDDLNIILNEMYIIEELIKIFEIFKNNKNIQKINEIKYLMRENANIFKQIYILIIKENIIYKNDKDIYHKLRYIFLIEIKKVPNISYHYELLIQLLDLNKIVKSSKDRFNFSMKNKKLLKSLRSNEIIKRSNEIFQILLKKYVKLDYKSNIYDILNGDDDIIIILDKTVNNNFVLAETLLYFFEKNALNYLENIINHKKETIKLEDEPLDILKDCYVVLNSYIFEPKELYSKSKEIGKLFCLGYIKSYIHTFIKTFEDEKPKFNDPKKIINAINGDNSIYKMIRIYIYKILYNKFGLDAFINLKMVDKYKLKDYKDFSKFIINEIKEYYYLYKIDYKIRTLKDDYYEESYEAIEKYQKEEFKNQIKKNDFDIEEFGIDNFYIISSNFMLSNKLNKNSDFKTNFFKNICEPLFKENVLLFKAIELFYNPTKYKEIKINSNNIKAILFGYRYCLNTLSLKNKRGIYYPLYDNNYINYLNEQFYPGNDSKYNKVYSDIINHFTFKPNEGCYVCLCKEGYYHSVKDGFPDYNELYMKCPRCSEPIGTIREGMFVFGKYKIIKRDGYFRIFRNEKEIEEIKKDKDNKNKLLEINYITLDEYKKTYIKSGNKKGIFINNDKDNFKNDKKIIRNLSQISFRILNYILYSHLFFARLVTNKSQDFDKYLPKSMNWVETLNECWNILKNQLLKENIYSIENFMSYLFTDLFQILNNANKIDDYESLIKFEDNLESNIQKIIKKYKEDISKYNLINTDKNSFISLLKEKYTSSEYKNEEFPFYEYFYYTDYLNEEFINEKLSHMDKNKYPILNNYLESKNTQKDINNNYSLDNLNLFNSVLNLINEKYFNKISREYAEKKILKEEDIYVNNKNIIDKFIAFYNGLKLKKTNEQKLRIDNPLCDFLLDSDNIFGINYKNIYKKFAKNQNQKLEKLLDIKIERGIFDINCKNRIKIQQINEKDIFTLSFPKQYTFIDILFDSSYRKILDSETRSNVLYKEYEIDYDLIEEKVTDVLLKNKKLLNDEVTEFIYNNNNVN